MRKDGIPVASKAYHYLACHSVSLAALSEEEAPRQNVSIMTKGAILGTTIGGMVKDNSSSIAGYTSTSTEPVSLP